MAVKRIVTGGQTGADQTALEVATILGIETGGWAPHGWRTEDGPAPWLESLGLLEHPNSYVQRTRENVHDSDAVVVFGHTYTPGACCTITAARAYSVPCLENPTANQLRSFIEERGVTVLMVAGNRLSKNPEICEQVREVLMDALA